MAIKSFRGTGRNYKASQANYKKADAKTVVKKSPHQTDSGKSKRKFSSKKMGSSSGHGAKFHAAVKSQGKRKFHSSGNMD